MIRINSGKEDHREGSPNISTEDHHILLDKVSIEIRKWLESLGFSQTASFIIVEGLLDGSAELKDLVEKSTYSQPAISQRSVQLEEMGIIERVSLPRNKGLRIELRPLEEIIRGVMETKFEIPLKQLLESIQPHKTFTNEKEGNAQFHRILRLEKNLGKLLDIV